MHVIILLSEFNIARELLLNERSVLTGHFHKEKQWIFILFINFFESVSVDFLHCDKID